MRYAFSADPQSWKESSSSDPASVRRKAAEGIWGVTRHHGIFSGSLPGRFAPDAGDHKVTSRADSVDGSFPANERRGKAFKLLHGRLNRPVMSAVLWSKMRNMLKPWAEMFVGNMHARTPARMPIPIKIPPNCRPAIYHKGCGRSFRAEISRERIPWVFSLVPNAQCYPKSPGVAAIENSPNCNADTFVSILKQETSRGFWRFQIGCRGWI